MYEELATALQKRAVELPEKFSKNAENIDLLLKAADAIKELQERVAASEATIKRQSDIIQAKDRDLQRAIDAKSQWISVTDRLPESQGPFLTRYGFGDASIETGQFFYGVLYYLYADAEPHWQRANVGVEVTHWMRIPKLPKEET